jgi:hypothetical protein
MQGKLAEDEEEQRACYAERQQAGPGKPSFARKYIHKLMSYLT